MQPCGGTSGAGGTPATGGTTYVPDPAHPIVEFPISTTYPFAFDITAGPDGNLWFTEATGQKLGRITPSGAITEFALPKPCGPQGITAGPDGNLWIACVSTIARITP